MGFGPLMTVDGMGGGAEPDTTGEETTVNSSLLCKGELSGDSDRWMGWVTGGLVEIPALRSVRRVASMSSDVKERAWPSTDTGRDDIATRIKGCGA